MPLIVEEKKEEMIALLFEGSLEYEELVKQQNCRS